MALAAKVGYRIDANTGYPKHFSGEVIVNLKNGTRFAHREPINRGAADNPVSNAGIVAKFMDNVQLAATPAYASDLCAMILNLDALDDARVLARALAANGIKSRAGIKQLHSVGEESPPPKSHVEAGRKA